jgi:hypothetical protein
MPETLVARGGTTWARNGWKFFFASSNDFHAFFRELSHSANLRHGTDDFTSPPKEGVLSIFSHWKIRRTASVGFELIFILQIILRTKHLGQNNPALAKLYVAWCSKGPLLSLVTSRRFLTRRAGFDPRLVHVDFVWNIAVLGQVLLRVLCGSPCLWSFNQETILILIHLKSALHNLSKYQDLYIKYQIKSLVTALLFYFRQKKSPQNFACALCFY